MATIDKRTSSKGKVTYRVRWREGGTRDGEWQSASFPPPAKKRDAELFKARVEANGHHWPNDVTGASSAPGVITLTELAASYLEDRERRVRSDRSVFDYRRDYTKWIEPQLGASTMIDTITKTAVQNWVDALPLAAKTVQDRHSLLSSMFKYAMAREWVDRNPCDGVTLPKRQKKAPKGLMPAEWNALHAALRQLSPDAADLAWALVTTGWRWSEITALSVFDVEDYGDALWLNMGRVVRRNAAGQHVIVDEGKGQASVRRIKLPRAAAQMVRERVARAKPGGLVFTTGISSQNGLGGSQWHYSNFKLRYWDRAVEVANLTKRPTPHWLRHTHVGWMNMVGASLPNLQSRIGHASIKTTIDVYGRMLTDVSDTDLDRFEVLSQGTLPSPELEVSRSDVDRKFITTE